MFSFFGPVLQDDATLGAINWNDVIGRSFDLASQAFNSFGGRTVGTQTYGSGGQVFAINAQPQGGGYGYGGGYGEPYPAGYQQPPVQGGVGTSVGSGVDGILGWALSNPLPVFLGAAGLYLLFREPPRRR